MRRSPALQHDKELFREWAPQILRAAYDERPIYAKKKNGITVGMAMTEKQGGSDLRATITTGRPATSRRGAGAPYLLTGHKWFFSVPMSDIFLTLAQTEKGLSCFIATGWLEDGSRNRLKIQRLKDKCGNKSNASSEVEFYDLYATMLGEEGRGIRTIIEMAHFTRLDFAIGSCGPDAASFDPGDPSHDKPPSLSTVAHRLADHAERRDGFGYRSPKH